MTLRLSPLRQHFVLAAFLIATALTGFATDLSGTRWEGTWDDTKWGKGTASLIISEDLGDAWECLWRDGSGIRYRSKLKVSKKGDSLMVEGKAKGRIRTITLKGKLTESGIECSYTGRDCSGTVTVRQK